MESLPEWLRKRYEALRSALGHTLSFNQEMVMSLLDMQQTSVADLLSGLEHAGYILKERDDIDQRMRSYRLASSEALKVAENLNSQLERWQQRANQETPSLVESIDRVWEIARTALAEKIDIADISSPGQLTLEHILGKVKQAELRLVKQIDLSNLGEKEAKYAKEVLKLFDASSNAYRSMTNVLLFSKKLEAEMLAGEYTLPVAEYSMIDGGPVKPVKAVPNKSLCPVCRRFKQTHAALALISGNPKMDSAFQVYRTSEGKRPSMSICAYCFLSGYVDLPAALITKAGQGVNKGREYLFITTPIAQSNLETLLDFISQSSLDTFGNSKPEQDMSNEETDEVEDSNTAIVADDLLSDDNEQPETSDDEEDLSLAGFVQFLRDRFGVEGYEKMAVLGLSKKRLRELRGFILPGAGGLNRVVAVRIPVERLVGEAKISGAVRRELVKATMYDFWQITGGSLHYNRITEAPFSVEGQPIEWEDMYRANVAYHIADRYARVGKYRQLNSGVFMLLLSQPRLAANRILRQAGRLDYPPKLEQTQEIIDMTENLATHDWIFSLGLKIIKLLVALDLTEQARGFWYKDKSTGKFKTYKGYELSKWIQRVKMIRDPMSARAWGNSLINGYRRKHSDDGPNAELVEQIIALVEEIITTCFQNNTSMSEFSREIANMDYYLLFYYNQQQAKQKPEGESQ